MQQVIVTGANGGLGQAVVSRLLFLGYRVVALVRGGFSRLIQDQVEFDFAPDQLVVLDVDIVNYSGAEHPEPLVKGPLAGIVNIAGSSAYGPCSDLSPRTYSKLMTLNTVAPYALVHAHLPQLVQGQGAVVNISSLAASMMTPFMGLYASSKAALEAVSAGLRQEVLPLGVDVYCLQLGSFATGVGKRLSFTACKRLPANQDRFVEFEALVRGRGLDSGADPALVGVRVGQLLSSRPQAFLQRLGPGSMLTAALACLPDRLSMWAVRRGLSWLARDVPVHGYVAARLK